MWSHGPNTNTMDSSNSLVDNKDGSCPVTTHPYRQAIGSLMYLMVGTRPDLAFAVGKLARFSASPTDEHWVAVKHVLRYVAGTQHLCIEYDGNKNVDEPITMFSDSDWAGDKGDRKSVNGYVVSVGGGAVSWCSRKQTVVAASSCEAEYIALTMASKEAMWFRRLASDVFGKRLLDTPTPLWSDNDGAMDTARTGNINRRNKHIDLAYHFVQDAVRRKIVELHYVPTTENTADILTKPLSRVLFDKFAKQMGLVIQGEF